LPSPSVRCGTCDAIVVLLPLRVPRVVRASVAARNSIFYAIGVIVVILVVLRVRGLRLAGGPCLKAPSQTRRDDPVTARRGGRPTLPGSEDQEWPIR
jgi:hypothetical protein